MLLWDGVCKARTWEVLEIFLRSIPTIFIPNTYTLANIRTQNALSLLHIPA